MKKSLIFLILIFLCSTTLFAQSDDWTWTTVVENGFLMDLHFINNDLGWIVGHNYDNGQIVLSKTTDNGDNWIDQSGSIQGRLFGIHFIDSQTGFAAGYKMNGFLPIILKTTNSGSNWQQLSSPISKASLWDVFFVNSSKGYIVGQNFDNEKTCILGTTDGTTWSEIIHPEHKGILRKIFFADENHGWTIGIDPNSFTPIILYTIDGGTTWSNQTLPSSTANLRDIFFINANTGWTVGEDNNSAAVYKTDNGGSTWEKITNLGDYSLASSVHLESEENITLLCKLASAPGTSVLSTQNPSEINWMEILESLNGGESWSKSGDPVPIEDSDDGEVTVSGGGQKTVVGDKYGKKKKNSSSCGVTATVSPVPGAGTVTPAHVNCECGSDDEINIKAEANEGWEFVELQPQPPFTCPESGNLDVVAYFAPYLTFGGVKKTFLCATQDNTDQNVLSFTLTASSADDWAVSSLSFGSSGSGDDKKDITEISLYKDGQKIASGRFSSDNGVVTFNFSPILIPASSTALFEMHCDFVKIEECPPDCNEFSFSLGANDAQAVTYKPGIRNGNALCNISIGCVWNPELEQCYKTIQLAVDEARDGDTIEVCPGTYSENVKVTKSISLKSIEGKTRTTIEAKTTDDHVVYLSKNNSTVDGFTIKGASAENKSGVYLKTVSNNKIFNSKITDNYYGIFLDYAQRIEIKGNTIIENKYGINAIFSNGNKILENNITKNQYIGIFMENNLVEESQIVDNTITYNGSGGIWLEKCNKILIRGNPQIESSDNNGITIRDCDSIKILDNMSIKFNNPHGIDCGDSKNIIVQNNDIVENRLAGIFLFQCWSNLIGGNRNNLEGNTISGNKVSGIEIKGDESRKNTITGNSIGTNTAGNDYYPYVQNFGIGFNCASENTIGGGEFGQENVISGNKHYGIGITGEGKNTVIGNFIGTNLAGTGSIANNTGIMIFESDSNIIGGPIGEKEKNVISGNKEYGIEINESSKNKIWGNFIGTDITGEIKLQNETGICIIHSNHNYIGIHEGLGQGNVVSGGNSVFGAGIEVFESNNTHIKGNKIGTNKSGKRKLDFELYYYLNGILLKSSKNCFIGGTNQTEKNVISGNGTGILIQDGGDHKIRGNFIGTDISGLKKIENSSGILIKSSSGNEIGGLTSDEKNIISGNITGIEFRKGAKRNHVWGNYIGTNITGNAALGNFTGIEITDGANYNYIGRFANGMGNIISGNRDYGILIGGNYKLTKNNVIDQNIIGAGKNQAINLGQDVGIYLKKYAKDNEIAFNIIKYNRTSIYDKTDDNNFIGSNQILEGTGTNTGISLDGSKSKIIGNVIQGDAGNAIVCKNSANPVISKNSISNNIGFGLWNQDETVTINAADNWWGDAGGPGGIGPGSGDEISGSVDFSNWRTGPVALVAAAGADTVFLPVGAADSVHCFFQNWENLNDVINVSITDSLGWLQSPADFTLAFKDSMGADTSFYLTVPASTQPGTSSKFWVNAVSTYNPSVQDTDSLLVICYLSELERIVVYPDSIVVKPGATVQFRAAGFDKKENDVVFDPVWSATSGVIDSTGLFTADSSEGTVTITVADLTSPVKGTAFVQVSAAAPTLTRITVTPDSVRLNPGGTKRFEARGYDQFGMPINFSAQWSASGGTIDEFGLFTASDEIGTFTVTAADTSANLSGQAIVIIEHVSSVEEISVIPDNFCLHQNYPNPFNPETTIRFDVKERTKVMLKVYDILGREVKVLVNSVHQPGYYRIIFDAKNLATGVYFYRIQMENFVAVKKMVVLE